MTEGELLLQIAATLKREIGPAIEAEYPKTQAFMAAVVLQKLGGQIGRAPEHQRAADADLDALIADLNTTALTLPLPVQRAVEALSKTRAAAALCALIESIYANRDSLGDRGFAQLLARVRKTLRAGVERRLEYAE